MRADDEAERERTHIERRTDTDAPPIYPGEYPPPEYPTGTTALHDTQAPPPAYPGPLAAQRPIAPTPAPRRQPPVPPPPALPPPPPPPPVFAPPLATRPDQDDLALASGRKHLKARQRSVEKHAFLRLLVILPTALVSLFLVVTAFALVSVALAGFIGLAWLVSGAMIFHRPSEAVIARRVLGMRRPDPAEARRLAEVWGEVTRRAGVRPETYDLWIQESAELNATATAGHIVGVTRHAMDRLPNSRLAAILAHELARHVGGHSWAATLADWYALPARKTGRWLLRGVMTLVFLAGPRAVAVTVGILFIFGVFGYTLAFTLHMWWLVLPVALAPPLTAWLHRRAEFRADTFAAGLGFGPELTAVLTDAHNSNPHRTMYAARLRHLHRALPNHFS